MNEVGIRVTSEDATDAGFRSARTRSEGFATSLKALFTRAGSDSATGFGLNFSQSVGPLIAKAPIGAPLITAVAAAGPAIHASLVSSITLGAGVGAVALGAAISAKNPRVASEIQSLKTMLSNQLTDSAKPFVPAMIKSVADAKGVIRTIRPELDAVFAKASTYLNPLVDGAAGFVRNAIPGFRKMVDAAEPFVDIMRDELPELGEDVAGLMESIGIAAGENVDEFRALVDATGLLVQGLSSSVELMNYLGAGPTRTLIDLLTEATDEIEGAKWVEPVEDLAVGMATAAEATRSFREEMDKLINATMDVEQASLNWQEAIDGISESIEENGKSLDKNTEKGRANRQSLLDLAEAGLEYADAIYEDKAALGDLEAAEASAEEAYQQSRRALVAAARQFGLSAQEAENYVTEILGIPPTRNTRADFTGDNAGVRDWKRTLSGIPREIFTSARLRAIVDVDVRREQATQATGRAHGGLVGSAQSGGARSGLTMVGEYGREIVDLPPGAHVRSNPDTERMLAGMGGGGGTAVLEVRPAPGADTPLMNEIVKGLIFTIRTEGQGDPQSFLSGGRA